MEQWSFWFPTLLHSEMRLFINLIDEIFVLNLNVVVKKGFIIKVFEYHLFIHFTAEAQRCYSLNKYL